MAARIRKAKSAARKKVAARKSKSRKVDWYAKGQQDALTYWHNMERDPYGDDGKGGISPGEQEDIYGYLTMLWDESEAEVRSGSKDAEYPDRPSNDYIAGFAAVMQERVERLLKRSALIDGIAAEFRTAGRRARP